MKNNFNRTNHLQIVQDAITCFVLVMAILTAFVALLGVKL